MHHEALDCCTLCPRECGVNRNMGETGYCGQTSELMAARASLHMWEEPSISGTQGSGTVFFTGCPLQCIYCQNHTIAIGKTGKVISVDRLSDIFLELQEKGAHNINLVTPSHFIPQIAEALTLSKAGGLHIPIVYNTGGYEKTDSLKLLNGLIDIYLPDFKYMSPALSRQYSSAENYSQHAKEALLEMYRQVGPAIINPETGLIEHGMIVRHLLLPGSMEDSKKVISYLYRTYGNNIYISIMNQYTPLDTFPDYPELSRRLSSAEYEAIVRYAIGIGIENGYIQEGETALESFIPPFDCEGIDAG